MSLITTLGKFGESFLFTLRVPLDLSGFALLLTLKLSLSLFGISELNLLVHFFGGNVSSGLALFLSVNERFNRLLGLLGLVVFALLLASLRLRSLSLLFLLGSLELLGFALS